MGNTATMINITYKDQTIELPEGSLARDLAIHLNENAPHQALAACINGETCDLSTALKDGDVVILWDFSSSEGHNIFWHTSAHVLAQAILRLWPEAHPVIGPPIEMGFYYDFANLTISDKDFPLIEKEMKKIIKENYIPKRNHFSSKEEALEAFPASIYKQDLIKNFEDDSVITAYRQEEFVDLCRGPHLPSLGKIKAIKILKTSGSYWKGDSANETLTRIYGTSFPDRQLLKDHLNLLAEAKKRDHKIIGPKLGLFQLKEEAPGMPFIYPKGMAVWNELIHYWKELHTRDRYEEIKTPVMMTRELWERSGHWDNYKENMYTSTIEDRDFAIKPMNCPGCMLYYRSHIHSYRELPMRISEIGNVHRAEPSGAISGLMRVRCFHQDDAHIFMRPSQLISEIVHVLHLADEIYSCLGLKYHLELSTRPDKDTIGTDEDWEHSTESLREALEEFGKPFHINEGDGAFYGPKIDFHIKDAIGRTWQCGTIQVDMALPEKFDLEYTDGDGKRKRPIMIHRALYGSIERLFGILIEHFAGKFPLWLSPRHITILSVADRHADYAYSLAKKFRSKGLLCDVDSSQESVSKKVRNAQLNQYNYILTVGDKEIEQGTASLRTRDNVVRGDVEIDHFTETLVNEKASRAPQSPYTTQPQGQ
jgi:threonyl-tRNA synthetase